MKTTAIGVALALAAAAGALAQTAEHPKEHPTGQSAQSSQSGQAGQTPAEHPKGQPNAKEHPKGKEHPEAAKAPDLKKEFAKAVEEYIKVESKKNDGAFVVHDDKLNKDWRLKLVRIHKDRIAQLGPDQFFACSDFKEQPKGPNKVDLDFYVKKTDSGWNVEQVLIHKLNGKPRFTYDKNNNRVPAQD